jgi:hypothetical protein
MRLTLGLGFAMVVVAVLAGCGGSAVHGVPKDFRPETAAAVGTRDVWVLGQGNTLVRSTDAGAHFQRVAFPPFMKKTVPSIVFVNAQVGYAYGFGGDLYVTRDGGKGWFGEGGVTAFAVGGGFAYIISGGGQLERSPVSRSAWKVIRRHVPSRGVSIAVRGSHVWLLGPPRRGRDSTTLSVSLDRGRMFTNYAGPCFYDLPGRVVSAGGNVVWAVCPSGMMAALYLSRNGGRSFAIASFHDPGGNEPPPLVNSAQIFPLSPRTAILDGGPQGPLYRTSDQGSSWERLLVPWSAREEPLWLGFATRRLGYALVSRKLWRTTNGGASWHEVAGLS